MENERLAQIISAYGSDILRFCRITAGSNAEGDELYQDTMLVLLEKQSNLDGSQNVKAYALSVAVKLWKAAAGTPGKSGGTDPARDPAGRNRFPRENSVSKESGRSPAGDDPPASGKVPVAPAAALQRRFAGEGNRKADETSGKHGEDQTAPGKRTIAAKTGGTGL